MVSLTAIFVVKLSLIGLRRRGVSAEAKKISDGTNVILPDGNRKEKVNDDDDRVECKTKMSEFFFEDFDELLLIY